MHLARQEVEAVVDGLFLAGVLINLVKGGDLLLRKHQREALQRAAETTALVLDETRPLRWFRLFSWRVSRIVLIIVGLLTIGASVYLGRVDGLGTTGILGAVRNTSPGLALIWDVMFNIAVTAAVLGAGFLFVPWLLAFIFEDTNFASFLARYMLFTLVGGFAVGIAHVLGALPLFWIEPLGGNAEVPKSFIGYALSLRGLTDVLFLVDGIEILYATYFITVVAGFLAIVVQITLACMAFFVVFLREVVWRIVEYDKGAWAAILLLLTIGLGISEVWLKTTKKEIPIGTSPTQIQEAASGSGKHQ